MEHVQCMSKTPIINDTPAGFQNVGTFSMGRAIFNLIFLHSSNHTFVRSTRNIQ